MYNLFKTMFAVLVLLTKPGFAKDCQPFMWGAFLEPAPQKFEFVEKIMTEDGNIIESYKAVSMVGPYAKKFVFLEFSGECLSSVVSLGSYALTNSLSIESGKGPVYHLDLYEPETHSTLDFFEEIPSYDEVRARALSTLN